MLSMHEVDNRLVSIRNQLQQIEKDILDISNSPYSISNKDIEYLLETTRTNQGILNYYVSFGVYHG